MRTTAAARRYAKALFGLAQDAGRVDEVPVDVHVAIGSGGVEVL